MPIRLNCLKNIDITNRNRSDDYPKGIVTQNDLKNNTHMENAAQTVLASRVQFFAPLKLY